MFPDQYDSLQVMSHAVVGFPSLNENEKAIAQLVKAGVNLIELQVPFTDPVADGHTLVNACHHALKQGGSVQATLALAKKVSRNHPDTTFILMSYLNPLYRFGLKELFTEAADAGIKGIIIPDLPVEQLEPWLPLLDQLDIAPILMVTPNTPDERIKEIAKASRRLLYVVSRMGVTGKQSQWGAEFKRYINRIRQFTDLPLAIGFGVRAAEDLKALAGTAEVAAVCSRYIEWQREKGSAVAGANMYSLLMEAGVT